MQTSDSGHFFETDAARLKNEKRAAKAANKFGNPIDLGSKILAVIADPRASSSTVYVALSAGSVRRVNINNGQVQAVYPGPSAPVTCLAVGDTTADQQQFLFAGSWDKAIWSWHVDSRKPGHKYIGHTDFVKAVICIKLSGHLCLCSGGADKTIIVWDAASGARLHTLQDQTVPMLAIQHLAVDPVSTTADEAVFVSASSDPHLRRWKASRSAGVRCPIDPSPDQPGVQRHTMLEHETTIYKLLFEHDSDEIDLWTCSADGTAKCLSRMTSFTSYETFVHGDHVRAVALTDQWLITAGRDEDVKFWHRSTGKLYATLQGHYDEVTDLVLLKGAHHTDPDRVCSVGIDGTLRTWVLSMEGLSGPCTNVSGDAAASGGAMTAEEEAELAALMDDDDE